MAPYLGDFNPAQTVHFTWDTNNGAGASVAPSVGGTVAVYKNNGTTQSTAGVTDTRAFDGVTGLQACTIDLSADGTFYAAGANFSVVLSGATIDGQSVNATLAHFSIENRNIKANVTLWNGSAPNNLTSGRVDALVAGGFSSTAVDAIWNALVTDYTGTAGGVGQRLGRTPNVNAGANGGLPTVDANNRVVGTQDEAVRANTAQAGAAGSITLDAAASATTDFYVGCLVLLKTNTGAGQARVITAYNGATKVASIAPNWATTPDNTTTFVVYLWGQVAGVQGSVTGSVASVTGNVGGSVASVTGNVGGNVVGSVASVTGAVGSVTGAVGSVTGNVGGNVVGSVASVTAAVSTTSNVKKNQALAAFVFLMTDSTTHNPATGKTVTVTRSINGAAQAAGTLSAVTEIANGLYRVDFAAADLNGNVIVLRATAAACDDTFERVITVP